MVNGNYIKGRRKEYTIRNKLLEEGYDIVQRSAGSHSPVDLFAIHNKNKQILFVQAKPDHFNDKPLIEEYKWLNGTFKVRFEVI